MICLLIIKLVKSDTQLDLQSAFLIGNPLSNSSRGSHLGVKNIERAQESPGTVLISMKNMNSVTPAS